MYFDLYTTGLLTTEVSATESHMSDKEEKIILAGDSIYCKILSTSTQGNIQVQKFALPTRSEKRIRNKAKKMQRCSYGRQRVLDARN
jgi:hypothetical protein